MEEKNILNLFHEISKRLRSMQKEISNVLNLNTSEFKILSILGFQKKAISQSELSEICCIDRPAVSRLVCKMTKDGLLKTNLNENNKKSIFVSLTEKGLELTSKIKSISLNIKNNYFNDLDNKNKNLFFDLLSKTLNKEKKDA